MHLQLVTYTFARLAWFLPYPGILVKVGQTTRGFDREESLSVLPAGKGVKGKVVTV